MESSIREYLKNLVLPLKDSSVDCVFGNQIARRDAFAVVRKDYERAFGNGSIACKWNKFFSLVSSGFRKEELIQHLIAVEGKFWNEHVVKRIIPSPDGSRACDEVIETYFPSAKKKERIPLVGFDEKLKRREEILGSISELQEEQKQIEQEVKMFMQEHELAGSDCYQVSWKNIDTTKLDTKRMKAEQPEIYEKYGKVSHYRRFEVKAA